MRERALARQRARIALVAASCAAACAQPTSAHRRERDAPAITLSVVRAVPRYGRSLVVPRVPFFYSSFTAMERGTRVRECLLGLDKHPVRGSCQGRAPRRRSSGHMYVTRFARLFVYKERWPVRPRDGEKKRNKDTYQCFDGVQRKSRANGRDGTGLTRHVVSKVRANGTRDTRKTERRKLTRTTDGGTFDRKSHYRFLFSSTNVFIP